jgi:glycosyltransferase involved in cell wall biosynthesis
MRPLVSILIPAYNCERWLAETLTSAVGQTWARKEIIVVDDGSRDRTLEIAKRFAANDVKVVTQANAGAPAARNAALALAQGDFIQWLDGDDVLHPEKVRHQVDRARALGTDRVLLTAAWGKFFFRTAKASFKADSLWRSHPAKEWLITRLHDNVWMNPAVWLVSRHLTQRAGPWDSRLASSGDDDGEYVCRVAAASEGVEFVPEARCYYRIGTVGSLNWNMETSAKSLDSLLLSLQLTLGHLLALEDSPRTREAGLRHLQTFSAYFYGASDAYAERLDALARSLLDGRIEPPRASWKYYPVETMFGPRFTRTVIRNWRAAKLLARRNVDLCLHRLGA